MATKLIVGESGGQHLEFAKSILQGYSIIFHFLFLSFQIFSCVLCFLFWLAEWQPYALAMPNRVLLYIHYSTERREVGTVPQEPQASRLKEGNHPLKCRQALCGSHNPLRHNRNNSSNSRLSRLLSSSRQ